MEHKNDFLDKWGGEKCPKPDCGGLLMGGNRSEYYYPAVICNTCSKEFIEKNNKLVEVKIKKER